MKVEPAIPGHGNWPLSSATPAAPATCRFLAVGPCDEGAALIAAMASAPARPPGRSPAAPCAAQRGGCRRVCVRDGSPQGRDAGPLTAARRASATARPREAGTRPNLGPFNDRSADDHPSFDRQQRVPHPPFRAVSWLALDGHQESFTTGRFSAPQLSMLAPAAPARRMHGRIPIHPM